MPFPCGQTWTGSTRSGHSPSTRSIDWQPHRRHRLGRSRRPPPGVVAKADATGRSRVRPPRGRSTTRTASPRLYAHLDAVVVARRPAGRPGGPARRSSGRPATPRAPTCTSRRSRAGPSSPPGSAVFPTSTAPRPRPTASTSPSPATSWATPPPRSGVYRRAKRSTFVVNDPAGSARVVPFWSLDRRARRGRLGRRRRQQRGHPGSRRPRSSSSRPPPGSARSSSGSPRTGRGRRLGRRREDDRFFGPSAATSSCWTTGGTRPVVVARRRRDLPVTGDWNGDRPHRVGDFDPRPRPSPCGSWTPRGRSGRAGPARRCRGPAGHGRLGRQRRGRPRRLDPGHGDLRPEQDRADGTGPPRGRPPASGWTSRPSGSAAPAGERASGTGSGRRGPADEVGEPSWGSPRANVCTPPPAVSRSDRARQQDRPPEGRLDRDRVGQPVLHCREGTGQGPHAVRDLAREAERPRRHG